MEKLEGMMKILILANSPSGLYKFRKELIEALVEKEYKVFASVPEGEFFDEFRAMGCRVIPNRFLERRGTNPVKDMKLLRYYYALIKKVSPDVVLTYTIKPNIYGGMVCGRLKIPCIANITGLGTAVENGGLLQKLTLALYKEGLKKARKVFFQNTHDKEFFEDHNIRTGAFDILPGSGVNTKDYPFEPYPKETDPIVFLIVGRIMKDKGTDEVLAAAKEIKRSHLSVIFRFIGSFDEDYREKIDNAEAEGTIEYVGSQKDMRPWYKGCSAIVHASYHEGMSNVLLEAASTGRPVIATDVPGCIETYEPGVTGLSFKPKDTQSLIDAIEQFLQLSNSKRAAMGRAGRAKVEREFDRQIVVDRYVQEIRNIGVDWIIIKERE